LKKALTLKLMHKAGVPNLWYAYH